jgi:surface protein
MKTTLTTFLLFCSYQLLLAQNFITRWNLATSGSGATQISFGVATSGLVSYTWETVPASASSGSGTFSGSTATITGLPANATIRLSISPNNFQRIIINNGNDRNRLTQIENWGNTAWTSMATAFYGCSNLQVTATDVPNLSSVTNMQQMFRSTNLTLPFNINTWNTAAVTNMSAMFDNATSFNQDIGSWNTAAVTNMSGMFNNATAFNQNIGSWNTGSVTSMSAMFYGAVSFNQNIGNWNTAAVRTMNHMFGFATVFNQNIGSWNTSSVTTMSTMFINATAFNQNIGSWNTGAVTDMSFMFRGAINFNQNIGGWNTSNVIRMTQLFRGASSFNQDISSWNTSSVIYMIGMFQETNFNRYIGSWNTTSVYDMRNMFKDNIAFNQNIGGWNTSSVALMDSTFKGATTFNQNISSWNTSNLVYMSNMFENATSFNQNIGMWNTANVYYMNETFKGATSFNQNLAPWQLNSIISLNNMFNNSGIDCANYSATLIGWNTNINTPTGRALGAVGRQYGPQATAARANLVLPVSSGGKGWTISDGGLSTGSCGVVGNTVSAPIFLGAEFCSGTTISVNFSSTGLFVSGNQFNIQLSDANGSFSSPSTIGTATSAGNVNCTIPSSIAGGENYRIRIVATNPSVIGNSNATAIAVNPQNWNLSSPTGNVLNSNSIRKAVQTINASNVISGLSIVDYRAGRGINLTPGFQVISSAGSSFKAEIGGCN